MRSYARTWFDSATPDLARGLRGGIATLVPFYLAASLGRHEFSWMALGGWLGTLVDPGGLRSSRAKVLSLFALVGGGAVALSELVAPSVWLAAVTLGLVAFLASLFRSLGAVWAAAGTMIAIVVAIATAQGGSAPLRDGVYFVAGAGFAALLSSVIWPIWTHLPLRRAEAGVFEALASYAEQLGQCIRARTPEGDPRWLELARVHHRAIRAAFEDARRLALGGRARHAGETRVGSNLRVLLGLAESQLPLLVALKETSELEPAEANRAGVLDRLTALAARNRETAAVLRTTSLGDGAQVARASLPPPASGRSLTSSASQLLDHLEDASRTAGALSTALGSRAETQPSSDASPQSVRRHRRLLWRSDLLVLRDACSPRSTFFHHGLRVALTVGLSSLLARQVSVHPHWITVTTLAVLQPYAGATTARAWQRVLGTVLGSLAAVVISMTVTSPLLLGAVMFPLSVAAVATHRRSYRLFTFFLTPVFVLLAERFHGDWWTAAVRVGDAALGGAIALFAAVVVFPSRERRRLPELLGKMLEAVAGYAQAVLAELSARHGAGAEARVGDARRAAGLALGETENALERLLAEPRHELEDEEYALQLITYARRTTGALTMLDTYAAKDLSPDDALAPELSAKLEVYVVTMLRQAAQAARATGKATSLPVPELHETIDARLRAPLARLLRGVGLISEVASSAALVHEPHTV